MNPARVSFPRKSKTQVAQIKEVLFKLVESSDDAKLCRDTETLALGELSSFDFILSMVI